MEEVLMGVVGYLGWVIWTEGIWMEIIGYVEARW